MGENKNIAKNREKISNSKWHNWKMRIGGLLILFLVSLLIIYTLFTSDITWLQIILFVFGSYYLIITVASLFHREKPPKINYKPFVSILIPAHNEEHAIAESVRSMCSINYQKAGKNNFEVIVIDDGSIDQTPRVLQNLKKTLDFKVIRREPPLSGKGKGAALNDGLKICQGDCILVFDADAVVKPDFLSYMTRYLADPEVVGVQAKVRMKNPDVNSLTSLQDDEFATFNRIVQKGRTVIDGATALGGNGQLVKREILEKVGGWCEKSITEDLDLSVSVLLELGIIKYCDQAVVYQEAVTGWRDLLKQRIRWSEGHLETLISYSWNVLKTPGLSLTRRLDFMFYLVGINIVFLIVLSYILGFIQLFLTGFNSLLPAALWVFSSLVFFPTIITGLYLEIDRRPHIILYRTMRFWLFCLHWIPVFFAALARVITIRKKNWVKTTHRGVNIIIESKKKIKTLKNPIIISSQDDDSTLNFKTNVDEPVLKNNLLIVEDEVIFAKDLKITIEKMGYNVIGIESSGENAIKKIAEIKPDLVLMDIILKGDMDGIEATHHIWDRFKIPVVYITAHSDEGTMKRLKKSPNAGFLIKPVLSNALEEILGNVTSPTASLKY